MANPPNFSDLARKQRLAVNNRLSFNSVVNGGSPASQSVAVPVPQIDYTHLYVSGLSSVGPGDPNGLYTYVSSNGSHFYVKNIIINTPEGLQETDLRIADNGAFAGYYENNTWALYITNSNIGDVLATTTAVPSAQRLPEGNAVWSNFNAYGQVRGKINITYDRIY
jgi:hypothetical protein